MRGCLKMTNLPYIIKFAVIIYALTTLALFFGQRWFIYYPRTSLSDVEAKPVELPHDDIKLRGWVLNETASQAILYYGGNAEQIEANIPQFKQLLGEHAVYLITYRGYGESEGQPSEKALYQDALHIYDSIKTKHSSISLIGRSLGTGIATYVAEQRPVEKLVLITPFDSIENVAREKFWMFPVGLILQDKYESWRRAKNISAKTLAMIAANDQIIPRPRSMSLLTEFNPELLEVVEIDEANHNTISFYPAFASTLKSFL